MALWLIVLENNIVSYSITLRLKKIPQPDNLRHDIIHGHKLSLRQALGVQFLLGRGRIWLSFSE